MTFVNIHNHIYIAPLDYRICAICDIACVSADSKEVETLGFDTYR